jgi:glutathione S-transferase
MREPILFGLERSVYTRIARLALEEKRVPYQLSEVEIFGPQGVPPEHLERHPFGRIPVLRHGEFELYETSAITRYIDERFSGPALQPKDTQHRARMNQIIGLLDAYAYRPMIWGVFVQRVRVPANGGTPDEAEITRSLALAGKCLTALERLASFGPFLAADHVTLADLHAYPMLRLVSGTRGSCAASAACANRAVARTHAAARQRRGDAKFPRRKLNCRGNTSLA